MRWFLIIILVLPILLSCASVAQQSIQFDEEFHKSVLDVSKTRIKYISCDIGLIDGLGIVSSANFPIMNAGQARAILQNPAISLSLGEMKEICKKTIDPTTGQPFWKEEDYNKCKLLGLGYRTAALGTIDILRLFPQLAPYLVIFGPK